MAEHVSTQAAFSTAVQSHDNDDQISVIESVADKSRNGRRISEVEKIRVFGILESCDKRRLGKRQQTLRAITDRCRAQDITDLSESLTSGIQLKENATLKPDYRREVSMYSTNTLMRQREKSTVFTRHGSGRMKPKSGRESWRPKLERSATSITNFRPGNVIRTTPRNYPIKTMFPKVTRVTFGGLSPTQLYNRTKWLHSRKINGPIQLEHYIHGRTAPCAPLMLPRLQQDGGTEQQNGRSVSGESTPRSKGGPRDSNGKKIGAVPRKAVLDTVAENSTVKRDDQQPQNADEYNHHEPVQNSVADPSSDVH